MRHGSRNRQRYRAHIAEQLICGELFLLRNVQGIEHQTTIRRSHLMADNLIDLFNHPVTLFKEMTPSMTSKLNPLFK